MTQGPPPEVSVEERFDEQVDAIEQLARLIEEGDPAGVENFVKLLDPSDVAYTLGSLSDDDRSRLFEMISPATAAELMLHFEDELAADFIEELPADVAARIVDELDSDDQADILGELSERDAAAILQSMEPEEAADVRRLIQYDENTAGGIMHTEYVAFEEGKRVRDVVEALRRYQEKFAENDVDAVYVIDRDRVLKGVVRLRDLVLAPANKPVTDIRIDDFHHVCVDTPIDDLEDFFDRYSYGSVCVLDEAGRLVGVVRREAVEEAIGEASQKALGRFAGIVGGEELRTMPIPGRAIRRLAFLCPSLVLSFLSVSIIAAFEPLIQRVTALAVFLPLIANVSGAAGNQSVAVSIRELALGLIRPPDVLRVLKREILLGVINGLIIGAIVFALVVGLKHESNTLGLVLGGAYLVNCVFAVCLGAAIPLLLTLARVDPAMVSSPILNTATDAGSFFVVLSLAAITLRVVESA